MKATITSKGQVTIPLRIRRNLGLKPGDKIEFDETSPILIARRVVDKRQWQAAIASWQNESSKALKNHPWAQANSSQIIEDLRGSTGSDAE